MSIQVSAGAQAGDHMAINKLRLTGTQIIPPLSNPSLIILSRVIPSLITYAFLATRMINPHSRIITFLTYHLPLLSTVINPFN